MYNFMAAFIICGAVVLIGEIVAKLTKAWVPSVFVSAVVLLIGYWTVIPKELVTEAHLMPFGNTLAMMLIITHMGTMISLETLLAQWRTVVLCVLGLAGMCGLAYFVCPFFMERELIIAGLPPLTGGIVAATMMQTAAQEAGLTTAAVFAISMYCIQGFAGYPLTAIVLKREGALLLEKYRSSKTHAANGPMLDVTKLPDEQTHGILHLPESWNSPVVMLMKLGIVTWLAMLLGGWTGISGAIWCLVLGVVFCRLGFLEPNILTKANSYQIMLLSQSLHARNARLDHRPDDRPDRGRRPRHVHRRLLRSPRPQDLDLARFRQLPYGPLRLPLQRDHHGIDVQGNGRNRRRTRVSHGPHVPLDDRGRLLDRHDYVGHHRRPLREPFVTLISGRATACVPFFLKD